MIAIYKVDVVRMQLALQGCPDAQEQLTFNIRLKKNTVPIINIELLDKFEDLICKRFKEELGVVIKSIILQEVKQ